MSADSGKRRSKTSLVVGAILLAFLPVFALWVVWQGQQSPFAPPPSAPPSPPPALADKTTTAGLEALLPKAAAGAAYEADGTPQSYDKDTVYEKIDGAAPPFLDLGMRQLVTQAYKGHKTDSTGCEIFLYDMGSAKGAKGIYDQERGNHASDGGVGEESYRTGATWFFHAGPYYVTVLNADEGADAEAFSEQLARQMADAIAKSGL